jgi:hypothetical protein
MIIKEYYISENLPPKFILREMNYNHKLDKFLRLYEEALNDFPKLTPDKVRVIHFGGDRYRYTWGIEFDWPVFVIPESYKQIETLEFIL